METIGAAATMMALRIAVLAQKGWRSLAPGKHTLVFDFKYDGLGFATLAFNSIGGIGHAGPERCQSTAK